MVSSRFFNASLGGPSQSVFAFFGGDGSLAADMDGPDGGVAAIPDPLAPLGVDARASVSSSRGRLTPLISVGLGVCAGSIVGVDDAFEILRLETLPGLLGALTLGDLGEEVILIEFVAEGVDAFGVGVEAAGTGGGVGDATVAPAGLDDTGCIGFFFIGKDGVGGAAVGGRLMVDGTLE